MNAARCTVDVQLTSFVNELCIELKFKFFFICFQQFRSSVNTPRQSLRARNVVQPSHTAHRVRFSSGTEKAALR